MGVLVAEARTFGYRVGSLLSIEGGRSEGMDPGLLGGRYILLSDVVFR